MMDGVSEQVPGGIGARIRSLLPTLLPTERAVAEVLLTRPADVIEMSSQQVAQVAGASRATVVRTCQSLGFSGYQQLRVMLARDLGANPAPAATGVPSSSAGVVRASFSQVAESIPAMTALLADADIDRAVEMLAAADRIVVIGNGLSGPLAQLAVQRLAGLGLFAEGPTDVIGQQVSARHLGPRGVLMVVSGSGANDATIRAVRAARRAAGKVLLVTAFARSPIAIEADLTLVVGMRDLTFRDELIVTTRIPQFILLEGLITAVSRQLGEAGETAHAATVELLGDNLTE